MAAIRDRMAQKKIKPRVLFMSEMCVLDRNSGAAISALNWLTVLQRNGFECRSISMSLFDGAEEYPFHKEIAPTLSPDETLDRVLRLVREEVEHNIFDVGTSLGPKLKRKQHLVFRDHATRACRA